MKSASTALSRFRVLDLTRVRAGPTCVRQLADWGADVIKIEMPEALEADGALGPNRASSDFQNLHRNKRSLTLNLKEPDGLALFKKLAENADVVVENFRPDVKHKLGIDYDTLKVLNPRLVYGSISGFGQDGPYARRPGFDQIAQGMGGLMSITGLPGQGPVRVGIPIADLTAGLMCAQGILVALLERAVSGEGQWVHTSLLQAQVFMLDFQAARWTMDGEVPGQAGNDHPTSIPTGVFTTADGQINLAVAGEVTWQRFCAAVGLDDLPDNPDFATSEARSANRADLNARINAVLATDTSAAWIERLNAAGVPCGEINTIDKTFADPQVKHLGLTDSVETAYRGETHFLAQPMRLSRTPSHVVTRPPERGEHTDEILRDLGLNDAAIADLKHRNVV